MPMEEVAPMLLRIPPLFNEFSIPPVDVLIESSILMGLFSGIVKAK